MLRDARAKISFDLESEGSIVVVCSRGRRKEAGVARYKRRHSSLAISFLLSARARARVDRRPKRLGALGSPLRVLKEGRPFSRAWAGGVLLFKPAERGFYVCASCGTLRVVGRVIRNFAVSNQQKSVDFQRGI